MFKVHHHIAATLAVVAATGLAHAQTITYELDSTAMFDLETCLAPSACPGIHIQGPLEGSFDLAFVWADENFDYYLVRRVAFTADLGHGPVEIIGDGRYTIGGETSIEQRMTLELEIDDDDAVEFDSGWVVPTAVFPNLDIWVTGMLNECDRLMLDVVASESPDNCYADCNHSTGIGKLDIFDFLCYQHAFVFERSYACDCDTSTGVGVCDIFDFLCFQDAFVSGCP